MVRENLDVTPEPQTDSVYWPNISDSVSTDEPPCIEFHQSEADEDPPEEHFRALMKTDIGLAIIKDREIVGRVTAESHNQTRLVQSSGERCYRHVHVDKTEELILTSDEGSFIIQSGTDREVTRPPDGIFEELERKWEIRQSKTVEPDEGQHSLHDFVGVEQAEVNPDACASDHPALDGLPAFLDDPPERSKFDPTTGTKFECSECNVEAPWETPLEAGIDAVRSGSLSEGEPEYQSCNETGGDIKTCDCCRCPRCHAKSIRARKTKEPPLVCNGCETGFNHPVEHDDREQRTQLYWKCGDCGSATQAPFQGIPIDLIES